MEYKHWCGNCQIRVYIERHYDKRLSWEECPYTCEYAAAMRCSAQNGRGYAAPTIIPTDSVEDGE